MLSTSQKRPLLFAHENETISVAGPRTFSVSTTLLKKKEKSRGSSIADSQQTTAKAGVATEDPYDLSSLQAGISTVVSRLRDDLSKLRIGGRFNTESLENLRVCLSKGSKDTLRLGDLAQVVPKGGRTVTILASEEEHIKPVTSAIVSSNLSLTPQPDAHNALQLNILIPPPTKELRDQTVAIAKAAMDKAAGAIRESRSVAHKRLQDMQKKKIARPDDVRKAQDQMEKLTERGQKEVKELFDTTRKALERV
ncbi:ribosome recycling factor domain-containing protein [Aspergillus clavatus NRRL 1]|uniref:Ribosome recycling factor, putative n=1 Tax=Aspergillus clavatus (strain ATCC 1007 / CBS 513.65 / DSM 816 / NCTC 3887 / NRRL 1 / QM 1276 / 107) TaxID=344612 RepID=A1C3T1_ASPCL|nr:ribosome recycling factor domain-containing protein [Aspergillus clavatus NRRL 1]EAW15071.1 ribosome recycling factor, putative [Aspergillus clavatus NRRL 1]